MKRPNHAVTTDITIPFHDCDPLFVVWHGRYFEYLEIARGSLLKSVELDVPDIIALGYRMFITDARCRYMFPLTYGETARVTAWFSRTTPLIRVGFDVYNVDQKRWSARAYTVLATTDTQGKLLSRTPDVIIDRLPAL